MITAVVALFLCARSPAAAAATAAPRFDGAPVPHQEPLPPPPVGPAGPVPDDLRDARARWGLEAQMARVRREHPAPAAAFSFAVIGDAEAGRFPWQRPWAPDGAFRDQLRAIAGQGPDLVIQLGDFVSKGTVANYRAYLDFLGSEPRPPLLHVIGNHDRSRPNGDADKDLYHAVFGERTDFFLDHDGWRLVGVDSSDYRLREDQLDWLDAALDTELKTAVFTHIVPKYLKGALRSTKGVLVPEAYFEEGAARFGEIVSRRRVERVYLAHIHAFGTGSSGGVRYVLTGGGGSPLYPLPPGYPERKKAHYVMVQADASGLRETVHELDGTVFPIAW